MYLFIKRERGDAGKGIEKRVTKSGSNKVCASGWMCSVEISFAMPCVRFRCTKLDHGPHAPQHNDYLQFLLCILSVLET